MMPTNGFQNYNRQQQVEPDAVGGALLGAEEPARPPVASDEMGAGDHVEHSPESTRHALAHAVGAQLTRRRAGPPGPNTLTQLRQMGVPESELTIDRASGLVEG